MINISIRDNERSFQEAELDVVFHHNRNDSTVISLTKGELRKLLATSTWGRTFDPSRSSTTCKSWKLFRLGHSCSARDHSTAGSGSLQAALSPQRAPEAATPTPGTLWRTRHRSW